VSLDQKMRNALRRTVSGLREILEEELREQLESTYGILPDGRIVPAEKVPPLVASAELLRLREEILAAVDHEKHSIRGEQREKRAVEAYVREAAFTLLNRFVALKLMERRSAAPKCVGEAAESEGFKLFQKMAPELARNHSDGGYRLFLDLVCDDIAQEVRLVFDRTLPASHLFPRRPALSQLLARINSSELEAAWDQDETLGWVYQYFTPKELRDKVRKASQAPRNSYELAIRNQFYTPDYVVRFLADNTLGRLWWEQHPETAIASGEYLVNGPAETPPEREPRDPRTLRVLDPACGSGHFLHYCFDLLQTIYREAWDGHPAGNRLRDDYRTREALEANLPGLILRHNLFGIDIDLRATQLTAVSLYLRAKRSNPDCPIDRIHSIHAAPMPGEDDLLADYLDSLEGQPNASLLRNLIGKIWERMDELAAEAGTLLKAERMVGSRVKELRDRWQREKDEPEQLALADFVPAPSIQERLELDRDTTEEFWDHLEQLLLKLVRDYAERAEAGQVQRRLFADDAIHGFAFLDALMHHYDVVLMNPPFGAASKKSKKYIDKTYPRTKNDVYAAFVERGLELLHPGGYLGAITSRTGFFLSSFQKWREELLLKETDIVTFADLGYGVLDTAMVETAAYVLRKRGERQGTGD